MTTPDIERCCGECRQPVYNNLTNTVMYYKCANSACQNCHSKPQEGSTYEQISKLNAEAEQLEAESHDRFLLNAFSEPKGEAWGDEFDERFTNSHPGDSGVGGSDPQEPVYEFATDDPSEIKSFISTQITLAEKRLLESVLSESMEQQVDCSDVIESRLETLRDQS